MKAMYYCEEFGYYVNSPDCGMCEFRHDCEVREEREESDDDNSTKHARVNETNETNKTKQP